MIKQYNTITSKLSSDLYPLYYLSTNYNYTEFDEMKHAEPLLIWWIERHFQQLVVSFKENYEVNNQDIICPIINFHTRRQTCYKCEQLIQHSTFNFKYIPIISFSELYLSDTSNFDDFKVCEQNKKIKNLIPFTKLGSIKNNVFDNSLVKDLYGLQNPINTYDFLENQYHINIEPYKEISEELLNIDIKTLYNYTQKRKRFQGIERFPFQFYIPSN